MKRKILYKKPEFKKSKIKINYFFRPLPPGAFLIACSCRPCGLTCSGGC